MVSKDLRLWLGLLVSSQAIYLVMVLVTLPSIAAAAGGMVAFDLRPFGYSPTEAEAFLRALSDAGRSTYQRVQLPLDLLYPPLSAGFLISSALLLRRLWRGRGAEATPLSVPLRGALALPVIAAVADLAENGALWFLLTTPQGTPPDYWLVELASGCTITKSLSTALFDLGLVVCAVAVAGRWLGKRFRK